jgi:hypothetical protein
MTLKARLERICYTGLLPASVLALAGCANGPASTNLLRRSETWHQRCDLTHFIQPVPIQPYDR